MSEDIYRQVRRCKLDIACGIYGNAGFEVRSTLRGTPMESRSKKGVPELRRTPLLLYDGVQAHPPCFYSPLGHHWNAAQQHKFF